MAAVWGADVLEKGRQGSVWEGEVWMDGMAVVAVLDDGEGKAELLERWVKYARAMVCPPRLRDEGMELR